MDSHQDWRRRRMADRDGGGASPRASGAAGVPPSGSSGSSGPPDDDRDVNPPWEHESGTYPAPKPAPLTSHATNPLWDYESVIERSYPGTTIETLMNTGTGKIPGVVPLRTGHPAWGAGVSAPAGQPGAGGSGGSGVAAVEPHRRLVGQTLPFA